MQGTGEDKKWICCCQMLIFVVELYTQSYIWGSIPCEYKCTIIGSGDYHIAIFLAVDIIRGGNISWMLLPRKYRHTGGFPREEKRMKQMYILGKRSLAMFMALLMIFTCTAGGFAQIAWAVPEGVTVTDGELLAQYYSLSDAQKALLRSNLLAVRSYTYHVPTEEDELVTVDADNRTITFGGT